MKIITLTLFLYILSIASFKAISNPSDSIRPNKLKFELAILPLFFYNSLDVGLSLKHNPRIESKLNAGANVFYWFKSSGLGVKLTYNLNIFINNNSIYLPIWLRIKSDHLESSEELYYDKVLRFSLGTGIGKIFDLNKKHRIRTELGLGYSQQKTGSAGLVDYSFYNFSKILPKYGPAFRLKVNYIF